MIARELKFEVLCISCSSTALGRNIRIYIMLHCVILSKMHKRQCLPRLIHRITLATLSLLIIWSWNAPNGSYFFAPRRINSAFFLP